MILPGERGPSLSVSWVRPTRCIVRKVRLWPVVCSDMLEQCMSPPQQACRYSTFLLSTGFWAAGSNRGIFGRSRALSATCFLLYSITEHGPAMLQVKKGACLHPRQHLSIGS